MKGIFRLDGPLMRFLERLGKVICVSAMWLVACIPIVTAGLATTALYYAVAKAISHERGYTYREFLRSVKTNWKQGIVLTVFYEIALLVIYVDYVTWHEAGSRLGLALSIVCIALFVLILASACYAFPILSRFELKTKDVLRMSFFMMFRHLPVSVLIFGIAGTAGVLIYAMEPLVLMLPGLACWLISLLMERIFLQYIPAPEEGERAWYDENNDESNEEVSDAY